jgi:hypothetical protein
VRGSPLEWRSPTGLPVDNRYQEPKSRVINAKRHGVPIQFTIADGNIPGIVKKDAQDAAAPNFEGPINHAGSGYCGDGVVLLRLRRLFKTVKAAEAASP